MPSWVHTFASACLSRRCYSPGTASYLADSQRLTGYLVDPEGLPVSLDPSSIPSYSFHGAHMECTTGRAARRPSPPDVDHLAVDTDLIDGDIFGDGPPQQGARPDVEPRKM